MPSAFLVIGFWAPYSKSQVRAKSKYDDNNNNNCWMNVLALCEKEEERRKGLVELYESKWSGNKKKENTKKKDPERAKSILETDVD